MSSDITQERIRSVLEAILAPMAQILLRCGVSYIEFAEISKYAFVSAASKDYGVRNRPTNIARVAAMTGISRKEVSRVRREHKRHGWQAPPHGTLPGAVLNAWHTNPSYLDKAGGPRPLLFAKGKNSFSSLVRSVSGDIPPGAVKRELIRAGAVKSIAGTRLVPIKRYFVPDSINDRVVIGLELGLTRLVETIAFNSNPANSAARFQRLVEGPVSSASDLRVAREVLQAMMANFSSNVDDYLSSIDKSANAGVRPTRSRKTVQAGVGLYYFEQDSKD